MAASIVCAWRIAAIGTVLVGADGFWGTGGGVEAAGGGVWGCCCCCCWGGGVGGGG